MYIEEGINRRYLMKKESIHKEDFTVISIYASTIEAPKYIK